MITVELTISNTLTRVLFLNVNTAHDFYLLESIGKSIKNACKYIDSNIAYNNKQGRLYKNPEISIHEIIDGEIHFPTGILSSIVKIIERIDSQIEITYKFTYEETKVENRELDSKLRQYQKDAVLFAIEKRRCIIKSPTGSGKSLMLVELIKFFPRDKILIIVPGTDLLRQLADTISSNLKLDIKKELGLLGGGFKHKGRITIGTWRSIHNKLKSDPNFYKGIKVLIIDECHHAGNNTYYSIGKELKDADVRVGFSATPVRQAGDIVALHGLLGEQYYEILAEDLVKQKYLLKPKYYAVIVNHKDCIFKKYNPRTKTYNTPNSKPDREEVYVTQIVNSQTRNNIIVRLIEKYNQTMVLPYLLLVDRIDHGEILQGKLKKVKIDIPFIKGDTIGKDRQECVKKLINKELNGLIASRIFNEAQDIPAIGLLVIAGGGSSAKRTIQQVGRITRLYEGKTQPPIVIDIKDVERYYLLTNYVERRNSIANIFPNAQYEVSTKEMIDVIKNYNESNRNTKSPYSS
jgi:superfamily II DNA or RNA helicase